MSISIRELILQDIETTLKTITVANGYNNTLASVQRWKQHGNDTRLMPFVVINAGLEAKQPANSDQKVCKFSIYLDLWMRQDDTDITDTDIILNSLLLDIEKALMIDIARNDKAENTEIVNIVPFETVEGQPNCGLIIELEITYQHKNADSSVYV